MLITSLGLVSVYEKNDNNMLFKEPFESTEYGKHSNEAFIKGDYSQPNSTTHSYKLLFTYLFNWPLVFFYVNAKS